jgi:hypothetical protein
MPGKCKNHAEVVACFTCAICRKHVCPDCIRVVSVPLAPSEGGGSRNEFYCAGCKPEAESPDAETMQYLRSVEPSPAGPGRIVAEVADGLSVTVRSLDSMQTIPIRKACQLTLILVQQWLQLVGRPDTATIEFKLEELTVFAGRVELSEGARSITNCILDRVRAAPSIKRLPAEMSRLAELTLSSIPEIMDKIQGMPRWALPTHCRFRARNYPLACSRTRSGPF